MGDSFDDKRLQSVAKLSAPWVTFFPGVAIMLTVRKGKMRGRASDVMKYRGVTPEELELKNKAIEDAIQELGDLIEEANSRLVPGSNEF